MITIENLKNVLSEIGFEKSDIGDYYKIKLEAAYLTGQLLQFQTG